MRLKSFQSKPVYHLFLTCSKKHVNEYVFSAYYKTQWKKTKHKINTSDYIVSFAKKKNKIKKQSKDKPIYIIYRQMVIFWICLVIPPAAAEI